MTAGVFASVLERQTRLHVVHVEFGRIVCGRQLVEEAIGRHHDVAVDRHTYTFDSSVMPSGRLSDNPPWQPTKEVDVPAVAAPSQQVLGQGARDEGEVVRALRA